MTYPLGRLPNNPDKPRMLAASFVQPEKGRAPAQINWHAKAGEWSDYRNMEIGDCTCAGAAHLIQTWTANATSKTVPTEQEVIDAYAAVSGYDGTPESDRGAVMQEVLNHWRKEGIAGRKILAFAECDVDDLNECRLAAAEFGGLYLGIEFPSSAMGKFTRGEAWDVTPGDQIIGGHTVSSARYSESEDAWYVITWGREHKMTQAFWDAYVVEAWVIVTHDWVDARGKTPNHVDTQALGLSYTLLTGEPSPFPVKVEESPAKGRGWFSSTLNAMKKVGRR